MPHLGSRMQEKYSDIEVLTDEALEAYWEMHRENIDVDDMDEAELRFKAYFREGWDEQWNEFAQAVAAQ